MNRDNRDTNNNNSKRKVPEGLDTFRDLRTPAPALRNNRRYTIAPGSVPLPSSRWHAAAAAVSAAPALHNHRQDDERLDSIDVAYQNYIQMAARQLLVQRAKERVEKEVDEQLSNLQHTQKAQSEDAELLLSKLSVLEVSGAVAAHNGMLREDFLPSLKDQIASREDQLQSLSTNMTTCLNTLPTKCIQPIVIGEKFDAVATGSGVLEESVSQFSSMLKDSRLVEDTQNELQSYLATKATLPNEHESVSKLQVEASSSVLQQELPTDISSIITSREKSFG